MGYDVYLSFTADVPHAATGERLREAFFTPDNFGPTLYVESGDTYVYGSWEGRNFDEESVAAWLEPLAQRFQVTFEVHYESDYDEGSRRFYVGADAAVQEASYSLEQLDSILERLGEQDAVIRSACEQFDAGDRLRDKLYRLLSQLATQ